MHCGVARCAMRVSGRALEVIAPVSEVHEPRLAEGEKLLRGRCLDQRICAAELRFFVGAIDCFAVVFKFLHGFSRADDFRFEQGTEAVSLGEFQDRSYACQRITHAGEGGVFAVEEVHAHVREERRRAEQLPVLGQGLGVKPRKHRCDVGKIPCEVNRTLAASRSEREVGGLEQRILITAAETEQCEDARVVKFGDRLVGGFQHRHVTAEVLGAGSKGGRPEFFPPCLRSSECLVDPIMPLACQRVDFAWCGAIGAE